MQSYDANAILMLRRMAISSERDEASRGEAIVGPQQVLTKRVGAQVTAYPWPGQPPRAGMSWMHTFAARYTAAGHLNWTCPSRVLAVA